jgi:hypothetical protein
MVAGMSIDELLHQSESLLMGNAFPGKHSVPSF